MRVDDRVDMPRVQTVALVVAHEVSARDLLDAPRGRHPQVALAVFAKAPYRLVAQSLRFAVDAELRRGRCMRIKTGGPVRRPDPHLAVGGLIEPAYPGVRQAVHFRVATRKDRTTGYGFRD